MEHGVSYGQNMRLMHMFLSFYYECDILYNALTICRVKFVLYR